MKYSYNWLKELSGAKLTAEKAAERLTMHSFELEGMEKSGRGLENVVVGEILEIKKHPNADKLQLTRVNIGKENLEIVCGATNIKIGDKVPVALAPAKLPNGLKIKEVEIRGVKSCGMLCAPDELGLGKKHSGILILDCGAKIGTPLAKYLGLDNAIFEIKVLPDRAHDAMSHVGVAREIAVLSGKKPECDFERLKMPIKKTRKLKVEIRDKKLCLRYIGAVMEGVKIKESSSWMKARLKTSEINSINNIVDATNYIMLELGQPLHAFDFDKLKSRKILVRRAKNGEEINLLDKGTNKLTGDDLLITDGGAPVALAGIKGGRTAEIDSNTKNIVLEAASFEAVNIRRTAKRLGIRTESSDRYEKEIDPNLCEKAIARVIEILEHTTEAKLEGIVDVYPKKIEPWKIKLNFNYVDDLLGEKVPFKEAIKILSLLGIKTKARKSNKAECTVPTFRVDLKTQEDLIEEIGRIWGYEKIKSCPMVESVAAVPINSRLNFERRIRENMPGLGFDEIYNYSFYSKRDADFCELSGIKHFELASPMNPKQELVRASLIPNILKNVQGNMKYFESFNIFEIGRTYYSENGKIKEKRMLIMAEVLEKDKNAETFLAIKGSTEGFFGFIGIDENLVSMKEIQSPIEKFWHPARLAEIKIDNVSVGMTGEISPLVLAKYKITKRVAMSQFDLEKLYSVSQKEIIYRPIRRFPAITRDISMITGADNTVAKITDFIRKSGGNLVLKVKMFDVFQKSGRTSLAFHIEFGADDRTLENDKVDALMEKIISGLEKKLKVEVRK